MNKKRIFVVSHKNARGVVRWISVNYWEVEEQIGVEEVKQALEFSADVRMVGGESFGFAGKWSTRDPEELLKEISMHGERFARDIVKNGQEMTPVDPSTEVTAVVDHDAKTIVAHGTKTVRALQAG